MSEIAPPDANCYAIRILERIDGRATPFDGSYVTDCDVDAHEGGGTLKVTRRLSMARQFGSPDEAMAFYQQDSHVRPLRRDGKPNRPLARYAIDIVAIAQSQIAEV